MRKQDLYRLEQQAAAQARAQHKGAPASFQEFTASELYCPKCKTAMPVREVTLLVLPTGDVKDYRCTKCGTALGTKHPVRS